MKILGLTGSIAMGKSEAGRMFRRLGVPVFDSDAAVHLLLARDRQVRRAIAERHPECVVDGAIDRHCLGARIFRNADERNWLERLLHPRVRAASHAFLRRQQAMRRPLVVLDIPLLFETGGERRVDWIAVVSAPAFIQKRRALARAGMTPARLAAILARQLPDREKRLRADILLPTGQGRRYTFREICRFLKAGRPIPSRRRLLRRRQKRRRNPHVA
ncbi:MAG: dephospho-CoA kinase [Alphaproteobacteria bacterium]|nr:MAG: dephospho-CoA kinase [Alphaproteobacteria bacterium]